MKRWLTFGLAVLVVVPCMVLAGGFGHTYAIGTGTVTVSNSQANSSWVPVSVLILYAAPATGTAEVSRASQDHVFSLALCTFSNVTSVVWVPDVEYPFAFGDALVIESSETNGVVQVLRKGD